MTFRFKCQLLCLQLFQVKLCIFHTIPSTNFLTLNQKTWICSQLIMNLFLGAFANTNSSISNLAILIQQVWVRASECVCFKAPQMIVMVIFYFFIFFRYIGLVDGVRNSKLQIQSVFGSINSPVTKNYTLIAHCWKELYAFILNSQVVIRVNNL